MDLEDDEEEEQSEHVIIDLDTGAVIEVRKSFGKLILSLRL